MSLRKGTFEGKKLLILGATSGEVTLVQRAQELGAYVIVTDNHVDWSFSPAKSIADEAWDISWSDIDALEKKCIEENIDGIEAGYSEFREESLIRLTERLGLPCYATMEQLDVTRDKIKFKNMCRECSVPTVKEYSSMDDVDEYPVIVKPVDRAGSIGIGIATNRDELEKACRYAYEKSVCKQIIIEKYIDDGTKIDFYYAVEAGNISLISTCDTVNAKDNGYKRVVQSAWLYPERNQRDIEEKVDDSLRKMIQKMGITYGCIFFSGFIDKQKNVVFFECGFRLEGGHQYNYVQKKGPYNYLDLFLSHALTGNTNAVERFPQNQKLYAATINLYAKKGVLSEIRGFEEVKAMDDCCLALIHGRIGECCDDTQAILNKIGMFQFVNDSPKQLQKDVEQMYKLFGAYDESGNDMIYDRVNTGIIANWWHDSGVEIRLKDASVSYDDIQRLLNLAHEKNQESGLIYATANQSVDKLIEKIGSGACFVALLRGNNGKSELIGTCTLQERILNYWYVGASKRKVLLLKLVGIHPKWQGHGIGKKMIDACLRYAIDNGYEMIVTDSAEENYQLKNLVVHAGFRIVDCCKYAANNFISAVYAKWIVGECPWEEDYCMQKYNERRSEIIKLNEERL